MSEIVSTNWLFKNLNNENLVIFDCSWYMPNEKKHPYREYKKKHIKNSFFFNIDKISKLDCNLPHMLPNIEFFTEKIKYFNIHKSTKIITYSSNSFLGSARVWWMFKYFGFENICVLNGGLRKWRSENRKTSKKLPKKNKNIYNFVINKNWLADSEEIKKNLYNKKYKIFDARNVDRFKGFIKEPRKGLRSGHIPNSKNIFWKNFINKNDTLISKKKINLLFKKRDIINKNIILSCGSGISACILSLSLKHGLDIKSSVYDGSWTDWGNNKNLPIEK